MRLAALPLYNDPQESKLKLAAARSLPPLLLFFLFIWGLGIGVGLGMGDRLPTSSNFNLGQVIPSKPVKSPSILGWGKASSRGSSQDSTARRWSDRIVPNMEAMKEKRMAERHASTMGEWYMHHDI